MKAEMLVAPHHKESSVFRVKLLPQVPVHLELVQVRDPAARPNARINIIPEHIIGVHFWHLFFLCCQLVSLLSSRNRTGTLVANFPASRSKSSSDLAGDLSVLRPAVKSSVIDGVTPLNKISDSLNGPKMFKMLLRFVGGCGGRSLGILVTSKPP